MKMRIHSLNGELDEATLIYHKNNNDCLVEYKGKKCSAIYNVFVGCYYVDDIYGVRDKGEKPRSGPER